MNHPPASEDAQVAVVGAGPVGMTLAGRLAQHGVRVVLLEQGPRLSGEGSKAICMQRETLEIWARLGIGETVAQRGVQWHTGRTYFRDRELFSVELPHSPDDHFPPFVNISQTEVEDLLLQRLEELPQVDLRWSHRLVGIAQDARGVTLTCDTPEGSRELRVGYLVGTDGAHSSVRHLLGQGFPGPSHADLFLICDIRAQLPFPKERRLFFDPPWNPGRQVLVHPQPDGVWRIDWQVPPETDVDDERRSGGLDRRIRAVVGESTPYRLEWVTAYRFHQRCVERFRIGRVLLAGDAAHLMSPFGARGLNSGAADAENLAWKLAAVTDGNAPDQLLDSYQRERRAVALHNLALTDRTMRFMVPHGPIRRAARNTILSGSVRLPALRRRVDSGRLSEPPVYPAPQGSDRSGASGLAQTGAVAPDVACRRLGTSRERVSRLRELVGNGFMVLVAQPGDPEAAAAATVRAARLAWPAPVRVVAMGPDRALRGAVVLAPDHGEAVQPYCADGARAWLVRPDGHLAGSVRLDGPAAIDQLARLQAAALTAT
ncbi:MAG TPA: FAD-dependent monooxygenase [Candidatus Limnocylindrales bacterium]|nr:FAD-dependent monooxygenase [Candidatus Limnocylindrales bacterium]